jgi:hypothetical protein
MSSNKHWNSYFVLTFVLLPYFTLHFTGEGKVLDLQNLTIYPWLLTTIFFHILVIVKTCNQEDDMFLKMYLYIRRSQVLFHVAFFYFSK